MSFKPCALLRVTVGSFSDKESSNSLLQLLGKTTGSAMSNFHC